MTQVVKIRNTGSKRWPATFVVLDGTSDFTTDRVVDDHGVDGVNMGVSEYAFDGLAPGQTKTIVAGYTAKRAGNDDITIGAWGDKPSSDGAPSEMPANTQSLDCQVAINP